MQILIIEDEMPSAERLQQLVLRYNPSATICDKLASVQEAITWFRNHPLPDLIFQDILLSDGTCFEIYEEVKISAPVIFTTAYSEYALRSFELNSIDYLVKPYDYCDIKRVLDKFSAFASMFVPYEPVLIKELISRNTITPKRRFLVRIGDQYKTISINEVAYVLSDEGTSFAFTFSGQRHPVDETISELESQLDIHDFFRISRKGMIQAPCIKKITTWFNGRLKLELAPPPPEPIFVSRDRVKSFKEWLNQ